MHAAMSSRNRAHSPRTQVRAGIRAPGLPAFDIFTGDTHGVFPGPRVRKASGKPGADDDRGLDRIERKAARHYASRRASGKVNSLAAVWVSVPFAVVFVLGCLTLG
jgi:hypothetical protein